MSVMCLKQFIVHQEKHLAVSNILFYVHILMCRQEKKKKTAGGISRLSKAPASTLYMTKTQANR
jgi:hypothetical protein